MILTCPSCGTQYVVKDGAIPEGGRQVRCASCKHSWHQDPEVQDQPQTDVLEQDTFVSGGEPAGNASQEQISQAAPQLDTNGDDLREVGSSEEPLKDTRDLSADEQGDEATEQHATAHDHGRFVPPEDEFAPFGQRDDVVEERRGSALPKILGLVLFVALLAAAFWFFAPAEWKSRLGLAEAGASQLQLMLTHHQRRELASGNELLAITGRVINPTDKDQAVPPIHAELRKASGEIVYSWTIAPPARSIPPGGRAPFNSAEMNVPPEGELVTLTFQAPKA